MSVNVLTQAYSAIVNCIKTSVKITNINTGVVVDTFGIWDTGATNSVITKSVAKQLGLTPVSYTRVRGVGGLMPTPEYLVKITLNNENITLVSRVTECEELSAEQDTGMLVGMNIIRLGDICITNFDGKTVMTFRVPSLETINYVEEVNLHNKCLKIHELNIAKRLPDKCACGSGKDYKNCHGKSLYHK